MNLPNEKVKQHYDRTQTLYNLFWMNKKNLGMHYGFWEKGTKSLHEAILNENRIVAEKLDIEKSDLVLDAGCGVGGTAIWMAENYEARVIGITLSEKQVRLAKKYAKERGVGYLVDFKVGDFCNTGFPDEFFTKIFGIESVCHAEKKEDFMRETYRILKPGGKLVVADFFIRENLNKEEKRLLSDWCYGWEIPNLSTLDNFREKLEGIGFKKIEIIDKTKEIESSSKRILIIMGRFVRLILKIMELLRVHISHGGTKAAITQYYLFQKRAATYNIFSAQKPPK